MRKYEISDDLKKILKKLSKKDKEQYSQVVNNIEEVINSSDPHHYKNLRNIMKEYKRVHIGHFVLIFRVVGEKIYFEDYDHHDKIY
jgi:YafQ family addiction module toxin component